jgi:hypothetical protein
MLQKIRATNCTVYLCGDEFDRPVRNGEPYALVVGNSTDWKGVDRAVAIVKDEIHRHRKNCG